MKIIKVENCNKCPLMMWTYQHDRCGRKDYKDIKDLNTFPKWCPLEDYKEKI